MKQIFRFLPVAAILLFAACSKKTSTDVVTTPSNTVYTDIVDRINANRNESEQVTGRLSMTLSSGKQKVEVGGNIKMKRNDVIQISLQVFGFVEAGRLELTPDYFLILNRIGKQYMKTSYKDVPFFKQNDIDFYALQALFWNELFVPGQKGSSIPATANFVQLKENSEIVLNHTGKQLDLKFVTNATTSTLTQTNVMPHTGGKLQCDYKSWARVGRNDFPDKMDLNLMIDGTPIKAIMEFSRLRTNEKWTDTRTNVDKKKLKQVSIQQIFNQILSLSN